MKIALLSHSFLPTVGGRELVVHHLAKAYAAAGHSVRVVGPSGLWSQRDLDLGYEVRRFPKLVRARAGRNGVAGFFREVEFAGYLAADLALRGADVVHAHSTYPAGYLAARVLGTRNRIPLVITPHGRDINTIPRLGHGMRLDPILRRKIDWALSRAQAVTAISEGIGNELKRAGVSAQRLHSIPNGVDMARFGGIDRVAARKELGYDPDARILIAVGNHYPRKGHADLVRAMSHIVPEVPKARLVLVGRRVEELKELVSSLGLSEFVDLVGAVGFPLTGAGQCGVDRLATLYAAADVYVSGATEKGAEGLSLALLEGLASRLPAIVTDVSGASDVVRDGDNGYVVPVADPRALALRAVELCGDRALAAAIGERGRERIEAMDWADVADQYVQLYRECATGVSRACA